MRKRLFLITILASFSFIVYAQNKGIRKGLFNKPSKLESVMEQPVEDRYSMLSLGTMFGASYSLKDMTTYKVRDGIVVVNKKGTGSDRILPSVYAFPSITILGSPGKSLSTIVPVNLNPSSEFAVGFGFSYGFNTFKNSAEIGVTAVAIWSDKYELNEAQLTSFKNQTPLPSGESSDFSKYKVISLGIGIYVAPLFK